MTTELTRVFSAGSFAIVLQGRRQHGSTSAEGRTLANMTIRVGPIVLTKWRDLEDGVTFEQLLDVPVIDVAYWLVSSWDELIFGLSEPRLPSGESHTMAERWALTASSPDRLAEVERWAETHCLEFAGSDFAVPNIVFQRRDDFVEISWFPESVPGPGNTALFTSDPGSVLVPVEDFSRLCRDLISWVDSSVKGIRKDPRVEAIQAFLAENVINYVRDGRLKLEN